MKIPEILAPAGNYQAFLAAVENGADAVYLGGKEFNARYSADNFTEAEIGRAVEYAHVRGRRVYATLNILLDNVEMERAVDYAYHIQCLGIDAVIVQDLGLAGILAQALPTLKINASTQMTIHNRAGVGALQELGVKRVVLARELSWAEISGICQEYPAMELEIFVHGALCYSYSGQCLMSSVVGGRSGNRGRCAQPCRLVYDLQENGQVKEHGHLLSPADLCLLPEIPRIVASGVDSLKIEGRMKRAEYVANVTRIYRQALDAFLGNPSEWSVEENDLKDLAAVFNRSFTNNQWDGPNLTVLSPKRPNNRGVLVGRVVSQKPDGMTDIRLNESLRIGDGIEVWVTRGTNPATTVDKMLVDGIPAQEAEAGRTVTLPLPGKPSSGDRVFRTHDSRLIDLALESIKENRDENRVPITVRVEATEGEPLKIEMTDDNGNHVVAFSKVPVMAARTKTLEENDLWDKIDRLGNTPFKITSRQAFLQPGILVPFSEINVTRRAAVEGLLGQRLAAARPPATTELTYFNMKKPFFEREIVIRKPTKPALSVRVADTRGGYAAIKAGADRVYLSFLGLGGNNDNSGQIAEFIDSACRQGVEAYLEIPTILRDRDAYAWQDIERLRPTGVLVGNLGALAEACRQGLNAFADYAVNPFNSWSIEFLHAGGASGVCLSPELNIDQIRRIFPLDIPAEYIVHGQMPVMVSEHCVAGNLMHGKCQGKCGRKVKELKDSKGYVFPIANDRFCRMHLFNSRTTCLIEDIENLIKIGTDLRIEALLDPPDRVGQIVTVYRQAMDKILAGKSVKLIESKGVLEGLASSPLTKLHLYRGVI